MKNILEKYQLRTSFNTELIIERELFIKKLTNSIDYNNFNFITDSVDKYPFVNKRMEKKFEGEVINNYFRLRKNFKPSSFSFKARPNGQGLISRKGDKWIISAKVSGYDFRFIILHVFLLILLFLSFLGLLSNFIGGVFGIIFSFTILKITSVSMKKEIAHFSTDLINLINKLNKN